MKGEGDTYDPTPFPILSNDDEGKIRNDCLMRLFRQIGGGCFRSWLLFQLVLVLVAASTAGGHGKEEEEREQKKVVRAANERGQGEGNVGRARLGNGWRLPRGLMVRGKGRRRRRMQKEKERERWLRSRLNTRKIMTWRLRQPLTGLEPEQLVGKIDTHRLEVLSPM